MKVYLIKKDNAKSYEDAFCEISELTEDDCIRLVDEGLAKCISIWAFETMFNFEKINPCSVFIRVFDDENTLTHAYRVKEKKEKSVLYDKDKFPPSMLKL